MLRVSKRSPSRLGGAAGASTSGGPVGGTARHPRRFKSQGSGKSSTKKDGLSGEARLSSHREMLNLGGWLVGTLPHASIYSPAPR